MIMGDNTYEISIGQLFRIALKHWWIIVIAAVLGVVIALGYVTFFVSPSYTTFAKVGVTNVNMSAYQDSLIAQSIANESSDILTANITLERAANMLNSDPATAKYRVYTPANLLSMIKTKTSEQSRYFDVEVKTGDPVEAKLVCEAIVDAFCTVLSEENVMDGAKGTVIHRPVAPTAPSGPNKTLTLIIGALVGIVLSFAALVIVHFSKDSLEGEDWLIDTYRDKIPMLAIIPDANSSGRSSRKYYAQYKKYYQRHS